MSAGNPSGEQMAAERGYAPPPDTFREPAIRREAAQDAVEERQSGDESTTGTAVEIGGRSGNSSFIADLGGHDHGHVSVRRGKEEFAALERRYSNMSQNSNGPRRMMSRQSALSAPGPDPTDVEKNAGVPEEEFNLAEELRANRDARDAADIKHKNVGVVWEDLEFMMPVMKVMGMVGYNPFAPKPKTILHKNSGVLKPGQMCLVLGRPDSGCSTFLKTIANQRDDFMRVDGNVEYAGVGWKEMAKYYSGETLYNREADDHLPTLTVAQTLRFALQLKTPKTRIPGVSTAQYREDVLNLLLSMLNIKHTANTVVGNEFIRGVSGGERKRVSIAEQFCGSACLSSWDNSTRGLDASTALDYAKSLRLLTDITGQTTFVSLYQAGEGIYNQFDKICVLNEGRVVYFGPASKARAYMVSLGYADLPRQTSADYLTGCTDANERRFQEGRDSSNVPSTPEQMAEAFLQSDIYASEMAEKDAYKRLMHEDEKDREQFRVAVRQQQHRGVRRKSPYTVSFVSQVIALLQRQLLLKWQNHFDVATGYITSIVISLIVGSTFYQLPETASGAFTRGGILFLGLLFNALTSFSELPGQMMGRPILYRQVGYRFYRPGAYALSAVTADIPYNASNIFIFCVVLYFMGGLYSSAGAFFMFFLFVFTTFMVMSGFFRTLGTATTDYNTAARLASVLISLMVTYTGYMIPQFAMRRWLFWITYLNPLYYGYEAIFANEFSRINLTCDTGYIVPGNIPQAGITGFPNSVGPNQVCALPGGFPGQNVVSGTDYMHAAFQYSKGHIWRNYGVLIGWFFFYLALQMGFMEFLQLGARHVSILVFKKEDKELKELNARLQERKEAYRAGELQQDLSNLTMAPVPFTWEGLKYTVPVKGGHRQLLSDVYGYVKPGSLTALMGASGAGKTTLLDVLAARKNVGVIEGDILMNGRPVDVSFARGCAYAEQLDVHEWTTTVREALRFSAYLRQPESVPKEEKDAYVEDIIELLELQDEADAMIGFPGYGISVFTRKRLTIGVELAAKPDLLLFLDEPTSGLDAQSAYSLVLFLRKLAASGQKILCTIHQPNALLFQTFDRLLLLQRGGECVYFGDIGQDSRVLIDYLERNGAKVPGDANPAEFMLEAIGAGSRKRIGGDWHQKWLNSPEFAQVKTEIQELKQAALARPIENDAKPTEYATSFMHQFRVVLSRTNTALWRNADYQYTRLFAHLAIAFVVGITFLQLDDSLQSLQYRVFVTFYATVLPALILAQIEPQYIMSRLTFNREASSKMYSSTIFALTQLIAEMPYSVLCATAFFVLVYFMVGFPAEAARSGYFFFMVLITEIYAVTLGQTIAALSPTIMIAALFNPFLLVVFGVFCGVTAPPSTLPGFWRFMWRVDPFTYLVEGLVTSVLQDLKVVCRPSEFKVFSPPSGETCAAWAGKFADVVGGYLENPDATSDCHFCQYRSGQSFFVNLTMSFSHRWRDWGIFICYVAFNIIVLLIAARFLRWQKR